VLFLDEFPEFPRNVLEALRQPLEDCQVTISRANQQVTFPADFLLVAAMNPCPCGWRGDRQRVCRCTEPRIYQYQSRISGPLLDRIDLHVEVPTLSMSEIRRLPPSESSAMIRERVVAARAVQQERLGTALMTNAAMPPPLLQQHCDLPEKLARMLEEKVEARGFSKRVHDKALRIARTIADLEGSTDIKEDHLYESLAFRQLDIRSVGAVVPDISTLQAAEVPS
jgi:magnesium chelatase family protein